MNSDIPFTSSDLIDNKLTIPNTRIVDFSVENDAGELVLPSKSYSISSGSTTIDFSSFDINGTWHVRQIPVAPGQDAEEGVSIEEYLVKLYLIGTNVNYVPYTGTVPSLPMEKEKKAPILGNIFKASGKDQFVSGEIIKVNIPAFGEKRQWVMTSPISSGAEGILYQFQIYKNDLIIFDSIQDSILYPASDLYRGNAFYFPENLPDREEQNMPKTTYYWRVRASYKLKDENNNYYWSGWSSQFPFTINTPPTPPFDLSVSANAV